jgi:hypothetical protein
VVPEITVRMIAQIVTLVELNRCAVGPEELQKHARRDGKACVMANRAFVMIDEDGQGIVYRASYLRVRALDLRGLPVTTFGEG